MRKPPPVKPEPEPAARHLEEKTKLEREIEIARLKATLAQATGGVAAATPETPRERIRKELDAYLGRVIDGRFAVEECRRELKERYKDDPDLLQDLDDALRAFVDERMNH